MPKQMPAPTPAPTPVPTPARKETKRIDRIDIVVKPRQGAKTGGWRVNKPVVDEAKCIACGTCERVCPDASIVVQSASAGGKRAARVDYDYCKGCGICANECPVKCISMVEEK